MIEDTRRTYRIGRHQDGGWLFGVSAARIAGVAVAALLGVLLLRAGAALPVVVLGILADCVLAWILVVKQVQGRAVLEWIPVAGAFALERARGVWQFYTAVPELGALVRLPEILAIDPQPVQEPVCLPAELAGLRVMETSLAFGGVPLGVVHDARRESYVSFVRCAPRGFCLRGGRQQEVLLGAWGGLLAALAKESSPIARIQWIEGALPASTDELWRYLQANKRPAIADEDLSLRAIHELLDRQSAGQEHQVLVAIRIDAKRGAAARQIRMLGGGEVGALALIARQTQWLVGELHRIGVYGTEAGQPAAIPSARGVAAALRDGLDPFGRHERQEPPAGQHPGVSPEAFGPSARVSHWAHWQADGSLHVTGCLEQWPGQDFRCDFLRPLLTETTAARTVSVVMEVFEQGRAIRKAETETGIAHSDRGVNAWLKRRATASERNRGEVAEQREEEIASGHALVRFAGYVDVVVPADAGLTALEDAWGDVRVAASACGIQLRRCYGEQVHAGMNCLPLCRGLA